MKDSQNRTPESNPRAWGYLFSYHFQSVTLELDGVLVAQTPDDFYCKTNTLQMLDFHKIEGASEILEGNEFKLNWTKAELTLYLKIVILTDTREDSKLVHREKTSKSGHAIFFAFIRRVRATSLTQRRVENSRVQFWTFSPVSVKKF